MFEKLLERLASVLAEAGIPYMIIGGQAVLLYGEPRLTKDVDVTLGIPPDDGSQIMGLLPKFGVQSLVEDADSFLKKTFVLPCLDPQTGLRVDFIFSLSDYEKQAIERAQKQTIGSTSVSFISLEDLVIHKLVASRPRDLEDVKSVIIKNPKYDHEYVMNWLEQYDSGLETELCRRFTQMLAELQLCKRSGG